MPIKHISSRDNVWYKRLRRAVDKHDDEVVLEGPKQIADAIASGVELVAVAAADDEHLMDAPGSVARLSFTPALLDSLSATVTPQGVLALCARPDARLSDLTAIRRGLLILDGVQDPGNVGTLIRLAAAFGSDAVVVTTGSADPFSPRTLRASAGASFALPVIRVGKEAIIDFCRERSLPLFAADGHAREELRPSSLPRPCAVVVGSEGTGLSEMFRAASRGIRIAIDPRIDSLNVAAAAAIVLWTMSVEGV